VCEDCQSNYVECGECNHQIHCDDINTVQSNENVCDHCLAKWYSQCEECDGYVRDLFFNESLEKDVCEQCNEENAEVCDAIKG